MSSVEIFVVVFCAVMGYLIVDHLLGLKNKHAGADRARPGATGFDSAGEEPGDAAKKASRRWWEVLGLELGASEAEIQHAYRREMSKYHPDKVAHLGEELKALAKERSTEINLAYSEAMRVHGKAG